MPAIAVNQPFPIFTDADGQPLDDAYIYIGTANQNPVSNPITVYWDAALTITAAQPIRTSGGYPVYNGSPSRFYTNSDYSILVRDKNGAFVYTEPNETGSVSSELVTFLQSGTGAVQRTTQSKLRDVVSVKDFGAVGDGVTDDTSAIQAAVSAGIAGGKGVYIPSGTYKVTSTITVSPTNSFAIYGDGGNSVFQASSFTGAVFELRPNNNWRNQEFIVSKFKIAAAIKTSGQYGVFSNSVSGTAGVRVDNLYVENFDSGFWLKANQFCSFSNMSATACNVGLYLVQDAVAGGGNNNTFYDCWFSSNTVGVVLVQNGPYPMHNNKFINLTTHVNDVCAFFAENNGLISIENWAPESNGAGSATYSFQGKTIKNGILHSIGSDITLRNYSNVSNTNLLNIESGSTLCFDGTKGASVFPVIDSSSIATFSSAPAIWYKGTTSLLAQAPVFKPGGINSCFVTIPTITECGWITNDALGVGAVDYGYSSGGTLCSTDRVVDSEIGYVLETSYSAAGSGQQFVINTDTAAYTGIGTQILFSALFKSSDANAMWDLNFAQNTSTLSVKLPANRWCRVVLHGELTVTPRSQNLIITPQASAVGATLRVCKIQTNKNLPYSLLSNVVRNGLYNPGAFKTTYYKLSAAPTAGTWSAGDVVYNTAPTSGGYVGWVCTAAGTPGTWKTFGLIS